MNLWTSITTPMRTIAIGGSFGSHFTRRTPGGIRGGILPPVNNSTSPSRFCFSSGTNQVSPFGMVYLSWLCLDCSEALGLWLSNRRNSS